MTVDHVGDDEGGSGSGSGNGIGGVGAQGCAGASGSVGGVPLLTRAAMGALITHLPPLTEPISPAHSEGPTPRQLGVMRRDEAVDDASVAAYESAARVDLVHVRLRRVDGEMHNRKLTSHHLHQ